MSSALLFTLGRHPGILVSVSKWAGAGSRGLQAACSALLGCPGAAPATSPAWTTTLGGRAMASGQSLHKHAELTQPAKPKGTGGEVCAADGARYTLMHTLMCTHVSTPIDRKHTHWCSGVHTKDLKRTCDGTARTQ